MCSPFALVRQRDGPSITGFIGGSGGERRRDESLRNAKGQAKTERHGLAVRAVLSESSRTPSRMGARPLGREEDAADDEERDDQRGADAAKVKSAVRKWLGEQVSLRRAERTGEDERQPE